MCYNAPTQYFYYMVKRLHVITKTSFIQYDIETGGKKLVGTSTELAKPILICGFTEGDEAKEQYTMKVFSIIKHKLCFEDRPTVQWS